MIESLRSWASSFECEEGKVGENKGEGDLTEGWKRKHSFLRRKRDYSFALLSGV